MLGELKIDIEKMHLTVNYVKGDEKGGEKSGGKGTGDGTNNTDKANVWPDLQIDASKMREVLLIILENAGKYNVDGGKIEIKTRVADGTDHVAGSKNSVRARGQNITPNQHPHAGRTFEMTIENTGIGLMSEDREKLFTRHFFRSKRAQTANPIGMGIGLSVARAVVRAHHGTLEIESDGEGMGARVRVGLLTL